jgi:uncharacterized membrane protein YeaQ/YmgE (transglycosylase-associated protein family)
MKKLFSMLLALTAWFAVITQYELMVENRAASVTETTIRFFSFFTILTNTLVAIYMTYQAGRSAFSKIRMPDKAGTLTAITVYITIVGLVYQLIFQTWHPQGLQKVVDELLHSVIPALVVVYWFLFEKKKAISYSAISYWIIYPVCYLIYILARGAFSSFYPYPFVDVSHIGMQQTLINSAVLLLVFVGTSALFIFIGKRISKNN